MLKKGQIINAKLIEAVEANSWIVSFQGQLLQVKNSTDLLFSANKTLSLQVIKENPLELKILKKSHYDKIKIDVLV